VIPLQAIAIGLVVAVGTTVVFVRDPLRQVMTNGVYGLSLTVLFLVFQAPDVALSMLVVGSVAFQLVFLAAINRMRVAGEEGGEEEDG
jgi:uncharacterized MnhB-related membrane protein